MKFSIYLNRRVFVMVCYMYPLGLYIFSEEQTNTKTVEKKTDSSLTTAVVILAILLAIVLALGAFAAYAFYRKILCFKGM